MYEKLDKLRADVERAKQRKVEAEQKVKMLEDKLKEAENNQVIADVTALKLTPEQVAQFLQMAASGQITSFKPSHVNETLIKEKEDTKNYEDEMEMEDYEDEN